MNFSSSGFITVYCYFYDCCNNSIRDDFFNFTKKTTHFNVNLNLTSFTDMFQQKPLPLSVLMQVCEELYILK